MKVLLSADRKKARRAAAPFEQVFEKVDRLFR
jgi:hypothetical protein